MSKLNFDNEPELEEFVFKNLDNYFSKDRLFISDKKKLKTKTGRGTLPDGILIDIENSKICLIENELFKHGVFSHIGPQLLKFMVAYRNEENKKYLRKLFRDIIKNNKKTFVEIFKKYYPEIDELEIFEELEYIIDKNPELYIFIDNVDEDLKDLCLIFKDIKDISDIKAIEVLKSKSGDNINYIFNDEEYCFSREEEEPIKELNASAKYWNIFEELISKFKQLKPDITNRGSTKDSWLGLPIGITNLHLEWAFVGREPNKKLELGIHLEHQIPEINHQVFDFFSTKKDDLGKILRDEIFFEKHWLKNGDWSRIYIIKDVETLDNFIKNINLKDWAINNMIKLYDFYMMFNKDVKKIVNENK